MAEIEVAPQLARCASALQHILSLPRVCDSEAADTKLREAIAACSAQPPIVTLDDFSQRARTVIGLIMAARRLYVAANLSYIAEQLESVAPDTLLATTFIPAAAPS